MPHQHSSDTMVPPAPESGARSAPLKTAAILLNWRRADLTLSSIQSLIALKGETPDVYVVDNHSSDDSVTRIRLAFETLAADAPMRFRFASRHPKDAFESDRASDTRVSLTLIESSKNLGFGGGMNLGLRAALEDPATQLFWVLNNDSVVRPDALRALQQEFLRNPRVGVLGSCLCYLEKPEIIQGVGGLYNSWLGTTRHVLGGRLYSEVITSADRPPIDYAVGAALCIRREVLMDAGLFPEDYFLYFEDMDWAFSVRKKAPYWQTRYALESVVLHQEGASTGANEAEGKKTNPLADYYYQKNRLRFARRWYPARYPMVHLSQLLVFLNRLRRRQWPLAGIALGLFLGWVPKALRPPNP